MCSDEIEVLAGQIHAQSLRMVLAITGGGSLAIGQLLSVPGGSRTLLEAVVPYSAEALAAWLGAPPEHACAATTARSMAMAAFQRARNLNQSTGSIEAGLTGVACTASLASDRPKRGAHRAHVAVQTRSQTVTTSLELVKGARSRGDEEQLVARLVLDAIAEAAGLTDDLQFGLIEGERPHTLRTEAPQAWQDLLCGRTRLAPARATDESLAPQTAAAIFPGAFNPLHDGHRQMAKVASEILGKPVEFEISIQNVDKAPLDYSEMRTRAEQFAPERSLWFTSAATFVEKARLFPGATFIVGVDTLRRIAEDRYYRDDPQLRQAAIREIAATGCRFLVFGRQLDGHFQAMSDLDLPAELAQICQPVDELLFRNDSSSTEIRRREDRATHD